MATRGTILITNKEFRYSEAKTSKTLLKTISDDEDTKFIYNHYDSNTLIDDLKEIIGTNAFKHYSYYNDLFQIQTQLTVALITKFNNETESKYNNLGNLNHYGVHITDNYYIDSEYIYWFDMANKELKMYETVWTFEPSWDIECLKLKQVVDLPREYVYSLRFDDD